MAVHGTDRGMQQASRQRLSLTLALLSTSQACSSAARALSEMRKRLAAVTSTLPAAAAVPAIAAAPPEAPAGPACCCCCCGHAAAAAAAAAAVSSPARAVQLPQQHALQPGLPALVFAQQPCAQPRAAARPGSMLRAVLQCAGVVRSRGYARASVSTRTHSPSIAGC